MVAVFKYPRDCQVEDRLDLFCVAPEDSIKNKQCKPERSSLYKGNLSELRAVQRMATSVKN